MNMFETRKKFGISQKEAASFLGVPLRTYIRYEQDDEYGSQLKRKMMIASLVEGFEVTENKGLLTIDQIKSVVSLVFDNKYQGQIDFCYLFGSYAKGYATEKSDIDLCIATNLAGLKFVGITEALREVLHKKIDLIKFSNLNNNLELINEIMKDGIKIYG